MNAAQTRSPWRRWRTWIIGAVLGAVVVFVGGPFVYIHFIKEDAPKPLSFADATSTTSADGTSTTTSASGGSSTGATAATAVTAGGTAAPTSGGALDGTWGVGSGSQVGYRVKEVLFGQSTEAVGRTSDVIGQLTIAGTTVQAATFTVDMTSVSSDESRRDDQFNGRIMDTSTYPEARLTLIQPIHLGSIPADLVEVTQKATADLTMHGVTKSITFDLTARRNGTKLEVNGSIPVTFADWSIPNPTTAGITTEDHGQLEFLLVFNKA